jgi:cytochrome c oxidase subunit 1
MGGLLLVISAVLFVFILASARRHAAMPAPFTFSEAIHPPVHTPVALNSLGLWVAMMIALTIVNYGFPIVQLASIPEASVPVIPIGSR